MKVYLAKDITGFPMYGNVPDLTQGDAMVVVSFDISDEDGNYIDDLFIDQTNAVCNASLDIGDYQYYNANQCRLMLHWLDSELEGDNQLALRDFYIKLKEYLQFAIDNNTGIAIEL